MYSWFDFCDLYLIHIKPVNFSNLFLRLIIFVIKPCQYLTCIFLLQISTMKHKKLCNWARNTYKSDGEKMSTKKCRTTKVFPCNYGALVFTPLSRPRRNFIHPFPRFYSPSFLLPLILRPQYIAYRIFCEVPLATSFIYPLGAAVVQSSFFTNN